MKRSGGLHGGRRGSRGEVPRWIKDIALKWESDDCLIFPFSLLTSGYGEVHIAGKHWRAHRYITFCIYGSPPSEQYDSAHSCGIRACMNKRHLRWATRKENEADKVILGRTCRGENNGHAKIDKNDVIAIRKYIGRHKDIAWHFGISTQQIQAIKARKKWAWL